MDNSLIDLLTKLSGVALSSQNSKEETNSTVNDVNQDKEHGSFLKNNVQNSQVKNTQPKSIIGKKSSREAIIDMINSHNARAQRIKNPSPTNKK